MQDSSQLRTGRFTEYTCVFIVRIWREPREIEKAGVEWRGVIEHMPTGVRRYFKDLGVIATFIKTYLEEMGVKPTTRWRVRHWLSRYTKMRK
jgi:hypothetical protein